MIYRIFSFVIKKIGEDSNTYMLLSSLYGMHLRQRDCLTQDYTDFDDLQDFLVLKYFRNFLKRLGKITAYMCCYLPQSF